MGSLLEQIKHRRTALNLKQHDMMLRIGMSRQQYQRLESKGNPRLETLELLAKGLNSELLLVPQEKLNAVRTVLLGDLPPSNVSAPDQGKGVRGSGNPLADDPWRGFFGDDE